MSNQQLRHPQRTVPKLGPVGELKLIPILSLAAGALTAIFLRSDFIEHAVRIGGPREVEGMPGDHDRIGPSGVSPVNTRQEMMMLAMMSAGQFRLAGSIFAHLSGIVKSPTGQLRRRISCLYRETQ